MRSAEPTIGEDLVRQGKAILLETRGRVTGRSVTTPVGFVEEPDGGLLVAAGSSAAGWARNLAADPHCRATRAGVAGDYIAERLEGAARSRAVVGLILRYGTPSERLGEGPAFLLRRQHP